MYFPNGKFTENKLIYEALKSDLDYKYIVSIKQHILHLKELKWLVTNNKTGYTKISSLSIFKNITNSKSNLAYEISQPELKNFRAVTGAVIFGYLHRLFWRKRSSDGSVRIKGRTYHSPRRAFRFLKNYKTPISLLGVNKILDISIKKASQIKKLAQESNYITVEKCLEQTNYSESDILNLNKYNNTKIHYRKMNQKIYIQNIDLILINFAFCKKRY